MWLTRISMMLLLWFGAACGATESNITEAEIASDAATSGAKSLDDVALIARERLPEMHPSSSALPKLIALERTAILAGDLELLGALWHVDALIIDARGTTDTSDDYAWKGRAAILDRYRTAVFANPPPLLDEADVVLQLASAAEGEDVSIDGVELAGVSGTDHWRFVWQDGRWWMLELVYGSPSS